MALARRCIQGHFNTTFTASKAVIQLCNESLEFKENLLRCFNDEEDKALVQNIIGKNDYMHFHLINSLIILNRLTETKHIKFAKEIIHSYLGICKFDDDKWKYVMNVFKVIRNISFNSIDLQVADLPYSINIHEKNQILRLLEEGLSEYNDNTPTYNLISSVTKLLDDTLYYSSDMVINQQSVTDKIVRKVLSLEIQCDYYSSYFFNNDSLLNNAPKNPKNFDNENYLKLTLIKEKCQKLYKELKSIEYVRCGYYDRGSLEQTIILSIDTKNENCCPEYVAFRVLSSVLKHLREIDNIQCNDKRYLLVTKYFLKYLLHASNIKIDGTLDPDKCVICVMGSKQRIIQLPQNITNQNDDIVHEVEFLKTRLKEDDKNDLTISIPASIK